MSADCGTTDKKNMKMKRILAVLVAFGFPLGISTSAFAIPTGCLPPQAINNAAVQFGCIEVEAATFTDLIKFVITPAQSKGGKGLIHKPGVVGQALAFSGGANGPNGATFSGQILAELDSDPFISYDLIYEASVATNVHLFLGTPIEPTGSPATLTNTVDGITLTDKNQDGVVFSPSVGTKVSKGSLSTDGTAAGLTNGGVDIISGLNTTVDDAEFIMGNSYFYPGDSATSYPDPLGGYFNYMQYDLQFDLSVGDKVHFVNGLLEITGASPAPAYVPEPGTLLLLGSGLAGLGYWGRQRKRLGQRA